MDSKTYRVLAVAALLATSCGDNLRGTVDATAPDTPAPIDSAVDAAPDAAPVDSCVGMPDGTACDDDNACTQTDTCAGGACVGSNAVTCTASDACHVDGVCDPATGTCSTPDAPDGTMCDDGNACTTTDVCSSGTCIGADAPMGTMCDDGNACTQMDACMAGACIGGNAVTCTASDACHVAGVCDPSTGTCSNPIAPDGTTCSDANNCTQTDTCVAGTCVGGNPVTCTASDACHVAGTCNPATGMCTNPNAPDGTQCNDNNACTQTDTCRSGTCQGTNPITCTASDQCHRAGVCNPSTGMCTNPPAPNGTPCDDSNGCTENDQCRNGNCESGPPKTCAPTDQCFLAGTCDMTTGLCSNPTAPDGTDCDDGDLCTINDSCTNGSCGGGSPVTCTPIDECHVAGTCNPANGQCSNPNAPNGTPCSNNGTCQGGTCVPREPACGNGVVETGEQCDDGNALDCDGCSPTCRKQTYHEITGNIAILDSTHPAAWCLRIDTDGTEGDGDGVVQKVCVNKVGVNHTWIGDLVAFVEGPTGRQVSLFDRPGAVVAVEFGDSSDISDSAPISFFDAATDNPETMGNTIGDAQTVCANDGRCVYTPNNGSTAPQKLSRYDGLTSTGTWSLCVGDAAVGSEGTLTVFGLTIQ